MIFCCTQANLSACLLAGDLTTFTSLLAEVAPLEDGGQTNLEDQQVNLSTFLLADDLTTFTCLLVETDAMEDGDKTNLEDRR
jgi:hypothetical protein